VNTVYQLAKKFRDAMERAKEAGVFNRTISFDDFPNGSCGDTCYLLSEFLLKHGIYTEYVWGEANSWSHAWLAVADKIDLDRKRSEHNISTYHEEFDENSNVYEIILNAIQSNTTKKFEYIPPDYFSELMGRTIIDITGDQFHDKSSFLYYDKPVHVGEMDEFHCLFEIRDIHECAGLEGVGSFNIERLSSLYQKIEKYIDE